MARLLFVLLLGTLSALSANAQDPSLYLPVDRPVAVDVMQVAAPDDFQRLRQRLVEAWEEDPYWFMSHVGAYDSWSATPYDPKLGMSEVEFERFVNIVDLEVSLESIGTLDLNAHSDMTGLNLKLETQPQNFPLHGVRYNGEEDYFVSKFGRLERRAVFTSSTVDPEIGRWSGIEYGLAKVEGNLMTVVEIKTGQRELDSKYVLVYRIVQQKRNERGKIFETILLYEM
ncbi:MAG: hypothetical protein AAFM91_04960 [Pseudomonadota bacterium]